MLGPTTIDELRTATACVTADEHMAVLRNYVAGFISAGSAFDSPTTDERRTFCHEALREGRASVWLENELELSAYMSQRGSCNDLLEVRSIGIRKAHQRPTRM